MKTLTSLEQNTARWSFDITTQEKKNVKKLRTIRQKVDLSLHQYESGEVYNATDDFFTKTKKEAFQNFCKKQ